VPRAIDGPFPTAARALRRYWNGLTSQHGAFRSAAEFATVEPEDGDGNGVVARARLLCLPDERHPNEQPIRLRIDGVGRITELRFPASYSPPTYVGREYFEERSMLLRPGGVELGGTLALPSDRPGTLPGAVFVHGRGPFDREYTVGPNRIFADLARRAAILGAATYRYDKRTHVTDLPPAGRDVDSVVVDDALAALDRLAGVDAVDPDRLYVVGHGLGGRLVPRIARRHGDLAGVGLLDAPALDRAAVAAHRAERARAADWLTERERTARERRYRAIRQLAEGGLYGRADSEVVAGRSVAWWRSAFSYRPVHTAEALSVPAFVATAGRGPVAFESHDRWLSAFRGADTRGEFYPALNHYLQWGDRPSVPVEYLGFHDSVDGGIAVDLGQWIDRERGS
jgi:hypothetical protein